MSILFDGNNFNSFPIDIFNKDTIFMGTIYLSPKFHNIDNKNFIKRIIVKGYEIVYLKNTLKDIKFNLIIRDQSEIISEKIPNLYYKNSNDVVISYFCKGSCGSIIKEFNIINDYKIIHNIINGHSKILCNENCDTFGKDNIDEVQEDLYKVNRNQIKAITINDKKIDIGSKGLYVNVSVSVGSTRDEKFQDSMRKEALRLEHAEKREKYKKHMRHVSSRKSLTSTGSNKSSTIELTDLTKICKATTKKNERCTNKALSGSDYCGIVSHKEKSKSTIKEQLKDILKEQIREQIKEQINEDTFVFEAL